MSSSSDSSNTSSSSSRSGTMTRIRLHLGRFSLIYTMVFDHVEHLRNKTNELLNQNNGFGPISKRRGEGKWNIIKAEIYAVLFCCILLMVYRVFISSVAPVSHSDIYVISGICTSMILSDFLRRCCLFMEEYYHADDRYDGSYIDAFIACISLKGGQVEIGLVFAVCAGLSLQSWYKGEASLFPIGLYIIASSCASICIKLLGLSRVTAVEISDINESATKNVSTGLAWTYYFGYLKIVLPEFENIFQRNGKQNNDENLGNNGNDNHNENIDTRLFVIIPRDGYCCKSFEDLDERITFERSMHDQNRTRGGVQKRSYTNSLYKVTIGDNEPKYVVMEYATPLLSMYEMSQNSKASFSDEDRDHEVVEFYKKVEDILNNDRECKRKAKLILMGAGVNSKNTLADIIWAAL